MKGYKVFNPDWTYMGVQYEVGKTFEKNIEDKHNKKGFHFCINLFDCFKFYASNSNNKVAEIEAMGNISTDIDKGNNSYYANKIKIIKEIPWCEIVSVVNLGRNCNGIGNCGNYNIGDYNTGNCNTADYNTGNWNAGNYNTGCYNSGNNNSGNYNKGYYNVGNYNGGNFNCGFYNNGDCNTGNWNDGNHNSGELNGGCYNTGDYNDGDFNSGYGNMGCCNTGNYNKGDNNSGENNIGDYNSGDWNLTSRAIGCFNTEPQSLKFFDKDTNISMEQWRCSQAKYLMDEFNRHCMKLVATNKMGVERKADGYVNNVNYCLDWWNNLSQNDKSIIKSIPNFDATKFYKITGIKV